MNKSTLAKKLSELQGFSNPKMDYEQYATPSDIAASILHHAHMLGDVEDKRVFDPGCGPGVLGIGAGLLGASHVTFLDIDDDALNSLRTNLEGVSFDYEILHRPLQAVDAEVTFMNPPFGTKRRHADKQFLLAAMLSSPVVYALLMRESKVFASQLATENGFACTHAWGFRFPLPNTMSAHKKVESFVDVVVVRLQQQRL